MAGVYVSRDENSLLDLISLIIRKRITHQAEIFQGKLSTIIIFIPCCAGALKAIVSPFNKNNCSVLNIKERNSQMILNNLAKQTNYASLAPYNSE